MKVQSNRFTIDNLDARTAYTLYYLAVDNFDRTSQVYTASIPAKTEQPDKSEITITSVGSTHRFEQLWRRASLVRPDPQRRPAGGADHKQL